MHIISCILSVFFFMSKQAVLFNCVNDEGSAYNFMITSLGPRNNKNKEIIRGTHYMYHALSTEMCRRSIHIQALNAFLAAVNQSVTVFTDVSPKKIPCKNENSHEAPRHKKRFCSNQNRDFFFKNVIALLIETRRNDVNTVLVLSGIVSRTFFICLYTMN